MSAFNMGGRRNRPFWIGILRTTPFIMAGILSLALYYFQPSITLDWNRDAMIGLIFFSSLCNRLLHGIPAATIF